VGGAYRGGFFLERLILGLGARAAAALVLLTSAEYRANLLISFFALYLHRSPSVADISFFTPMFTAGFTDEQIREWAETYIATEGSGSVDGLVAWIAEKERQ